MPLLLPSPAVAGAPDVTSIPSYSWCSCCCWCPAPHADNIAAADTRAAACVTGVAGVLAATVVSVTAITGIPGLAGALLFLVSLLLLAT